MLQSVVPLRDHSVILGNRSFHRITCGGNRLKRGLHEQDTIELISDIAKTNIYYIVMGPFEGHFMCEIEILTHAGETSVPDHERGISWVINRKSNISTGTPLRPPARDLHVHLGK